jgi:hypothetical protein
MDIRKISIGADYKNAMHYVVGQKVLGDTNEIHLIRRDQLGAIRIYIANKKQEIVLWKEFNDTIPISIEFNIDF